MILARTSEGENTNAGRRGFSVYYEIYIDVLFFVNLVMDYLLLSAAAKLLRCGASRPRLLAGSLVGALGFCVVISLPVSGRILRALLIHGAVGSLMVWTGLRPKSPAAFAKSLVCMYLGAFLLGGVVNWLYPYVGAAFLRNFLLLSAASYAVICLILKAYDYFRGRRKKFCRAVLWNNGNSRTLCGLLDTGNCLTDPASGKKVHVADYDSVKELFTEKERAQLLAMYEYRQGESAAAQEKFRYIPFRSVGRPHGLLPAATIDRMDIYLEDRKVTADAPVIMVSKERLGGGGDYRIIINTEGL